jgi:hypothetical protein
MSPHSLATAQVNNAVACAAAVLPQKRASQYTVAMLAEIEKLERYKVWRIVKKSQGMQILDARWVYTQKPTGGRQNGL